jgi:hypothetical protein
VARVGEALQRPPARGGSPRLVRLLRTPVRLSEGEGCRVRPKSTDVDGNRPTERSSVLADFLEQIKRAREAAERPAPDQERMKPVEAGLRPMAGEER